MFRAVLLIRAPNWKQCKCRLMHEWINTIWYIHTVKYQQYKGTNSCINLMDFIQTRINLENAIPSERSQTQKKTAYSMIPFI